MTEVLTAAQMRAIENRAISAGRVTGLALMERAGEGVAEAIRHEWPELGQGLRQGNAAPCAVVLCGPGNNGGDGFVVARLLAGEGWTVECWLYGDAALLPPDARGNYLRWSASGPVRPWDDAAQSSWLGGGEAAPDLVVDALFGIGLTRPLPPAVSRVLSALRPPPGLSGSAQLRAGPRIVAIDLPSGICSDSGRPMGAIAADLTVTFHRPKIGHLMVEHCGPNGGAMGCNRLVVVDIGLDPDGDDSRVEWIRGPDPGIRKLPMQHKYDHGHAVVLAGGTARGGAARMAARAALRVGAGLVTLIPPPGALSENAARLDAVMLRPAADAAELAGLLQDSRINALCLGPGLGLGPREAGLVGQALCQRRATLLDADALTLLARDPSLFGLLHEKCVLTPHAGEFARLFPDLAERFSTAPAGGAAFSKVDVCRAAAKHCGAVVLYKGADTVIAAPDGRACLQAAVYGREVPWLATAGAGDVLAGLITGLLARGLDPLAAAGSGAWLHVECAKIFGPGLIAEDLAEELPGLLRRLGV